MSDGVEILNPSGQSKVVFLCEHASKFIPEHYNNLGLTKEAETSHAAWDPSARELTLRLSQELNATAILSKVSRLVYDCNRPPEAPSAIPEQSELIMVPGNVGLSQSQRDGRARQVYHPFCQVVSEVLDQRGQEAPVVTIHSFSPVYLGAPRSMEIGLLHDSDRRLVDAMLAHAEMLPERKVERNSPYGPEDGVTHSLVLHALSRGLRNVMIEVRNDLMETSEEVEQIATEVLSLLLPALKENQ